MYTSVIIILILQLSVCACVIMKALKCKTLGAEFATELLVGNG